jgi:thiamine pyrophosphate-dependent acetolactate synthase large subunit-like protein
LPIKIVVMKNNSLGQIKWEQMMFLGNPEYECDLQPIDFATVARGFGITGSRASNAIDLSTALDMAFGAEGPALVEATVDPNEPLLPPKRMEKYADNLEKALDRGTPGAERIRAALKREPSRTMLS